MALLKQVDFASACKIPKSSLATYILRGKVVKEASGLINDKLKINKEFKEKRLELEELKSKKKVVKPVIKSKKQAIPSKNATKSKKTASKPVKSGAKATKTVTKAAKMPKDDSLWNLEKQQKALNISSTEADLRMKRLKEEKLKGELLPRELISAVLIQHFEQTKIAYMDGGKSLIVLFSQKKGLTSEESAWFNKEFTKIVNKAIDRAVDGSLKGAANLAKEYALLRDRGEKK